MHLTDPLQIWNTLKKMYDVQSPSRRLALKERFYSLRMTEGKTVDSHLQDTNSIISQLASLGVVIEDEDLVDQMLASLPRSWATFKAIQKGRDRSPSYSELQGLMLHEESSQILDRSQESEDVMYLQGKGDRYYRPPHHRDQQGRGAAPTNRGGRAGRGGRGRGRSSTTRVCRKCGKPGHLEADCDITKVERQIRDLQTQLSRLKATDSAYLSVDDGPADDEEDIEDPDDSQASLNACIAAFASDEEPWFLDSGASSHVTRNASLMTNPTESSVSSIRTAVGQVLPVKNKGTVSFPTSKIKSVGDVLYVPGVNTNLLSVGSLADLGHNILFTSKHCMIFDSSFQQLLLQAHRDPRSKLYKLAETQHPSSTSALAVQHTPHVSVETADLWHRRLAHVNRQSLYHMTNKHLVNGVPKIPYIKHHCDNCALGKSHRQSFPKLRTTFTNGPLQLIHSDLCGPFPTTTRSNCKYILTFIDDFSRKSWLYFLTHKSQTLSYFTKFKALVETPQQKIKAIRTDRGGEYVSNDFIRFCSTHGIHHQLTAGYSPEQNGVAERRNRYLLEGIRSTILGTRVPRSLWDEIAKAVNYIQNRLPCRALNTKTPEEMFTGKKPDLSHLVF